MQKSQEEIALESYLAKRALERRWYYVG